jgi:V/A-type H+-transporting ATPase subunit A
MDKQFKMLRNIMIFHHLSMDALRKGAPLKGLFDLPIRVEISRMRYLDEGSIGSLDELEDRMKREINEVTPVGGENDAA